VLAFDRHGRGATAVVLLHGVGGGRAIWGDEASGTTRALGDAGYTTIAVDLPGYGGSPLPAVLTTASMAGAVAQTIRALGLPRAVLVGHSMGGMVAQELAATDPACVAGLVLACTSPAFGKADGAWQQAFLRERLALLDAGQGMAGLAAALVPGMVAPDAAAAAVGQATRVMARVPQATYRAALAAIVGFDRRDALGAIGVPTLVLAAEHDRTAPPAVMQRMAERIACAEYRCLAGAGHVANVEQPAAFNGALLAFLARNFPTD
jgi:pimeloyl-ACP methyl ester carboxylesterase